MIPVIKCECGGEFRIVIHSTSPPVTEWQCQKCFINIEVHPPVCDPDNKQDHVQTNCSPEDPT